MQAAIAHLTASLLLVQVLTGWCWRCAAESPACTAHAQAASHCHCNHESEDSSEAPADCPRECQGVCVYLTAGNVHLDLTLLDYAFTFGVVPADLSCSQVSAVHWERAGDFTPLRAPLRLHLLHQLLLI